MTPRERHDNKKQMFMGACLLLAVLLVLAFTVLIGTGRSANITVIQTLLLATVIVAVLGTCLVGALQYGNAPIGLICPSSTCRHRVYSNEPWVCRCGEKYPRTEPEPKSFIDTECRKCGRLPQTLQCPLCEQGIPLGDVREDDPRLWIKCLTFSYAADQPKPSRVEVLQESELELVHEERLNDKRLDVIMSLARLEDFRTTREEKNESTENKIKRLFTEYLGETGAIERHYEELQHKLGEIANVDKRKHWLDNLDDVYERVKSDLRGGDYPMS